MIDSKAPQLTLWVAFAALLTCCAYLIHPLSDDPAIHITGIHQAIVREDGLSHAWTFRGPTYNAYLWCVYHFATHFAGFFEIQSFSYWAKALQLLMIILSCGVFARGVSQSINGFQRLGPLIWATSVWSVCSAMQNISLHAEEVAVVLSFLSMGASLLGPTGALIAGIIASTLPLLKGITALLVIPLFLFIGVQRNSRSAYAFWLIGFVFGVAAQGCYFNFNSFTSVIDLWEAKTFQKSEAANLGQRLVRFRIRWVEQWLYLPILPLSVPCLVYALPQLIRRRRLYEAAYLLLSWLVVLIIPLIQDKYFKYHFSVAACTATYTVLVAAKIVLHERSSKRSVIAALASAALCIPFAWEMDHPWLFDRKFILLTYFLGLAGAIVLSLTSRKTKRQVSPLQRLAFLAIAATAILVWLGGAQQLAGAASVRKVESQVKKRKLAEELEEKYDLKTRDLLLLTYGESTRYLDIKSHCRHFFPIPVQRFHLEYKNDFETEKGFQENRSCILDYNGKYALIEESWFYRSQLKRELKEEVTRRYKVIKKIKFGKRKLRLLQKRRKPRKPKPISDLFKPLQF